MAWPAKRSHGIGINSITSLQFTVSCGRKHTRDVQAEGHDMRRKFNMCNFSDVYSKKPLSQVEEFRLSKTERTKEGKGSKSFKPQ